MAIGRWGRASWVACAALAAGSARGAEVTDMPPEMGGSATIAYSGSHLSGGLEEQDIRVADRRITRHDLDIGIEVSPVRGFAVTLDIAATPSSTWSYPGATPMVFDPIGGSGTYLSPADIEAADPDQIGAPAGATGTSTPTGAVAADGEAPGFTASGLDGVWIGVAVAPFSQSYARYQATNWRLDAAFRTPGKSHSLWVETAPGKRGAAPGGTALRLQGAWSSDLGVGEPYLVATWHHEGKFTGPTTAPDGTAGPDLALRPASTIGVTGGIELDAWEDAEAGNKVSVDLFGGARYTTWEDVATGVYLPETLQTGSAIPMTTSEYIAANLGLGVNVHAADHVRARVGMTGSFATPHRLEHLYPVETTWDTWELGWYLSLGGVGGLPAEEAAAE